VAAVPSRLKTFVVVIALACGVLAAPAAPVAQRGAASGGVPRRIVSLVPATTEMLFDMGQGARIAGVGSYDRFPPDVEKLPRLGGLLDPGVEQLIAINPDLAIVYDTQADLRRQLERAGIPMFLYRHEGLSDISVTMRELGQRIGSGEAADAAAKRLESQLADIRSRVAGRVRPRTLLVFGRQPGSLRGINASGGYGFLHDLVELAGAADVLADVRQAAVSMSTEMVLARAPDVIIEVHYGASLQGLQIERERRVWDALPSVPAVRNGRIYLLTGDEFVVPGPRVVIAARRFAETLHPAAFR
jgi:iron complex transport system substrate-binding protein